jgi:5'-nucleotidase/UDP-sugar diphosphatase
MRNRILPCFAAIACTLVIMLPSCTSDSGDDTSTDTSSDLFRLTVLHTNDVHGRVGEFNTHGSTCTAEESAENECFGGVSRRATVIHQKREANPNTILVDAGDEFQGTLWYTHYKGLAARTFMNMLGYDAMTLGNHEFDDGPEVLAGFIDGLEFPVVSSTIDVVDEPLLRDKIVKYTILDVNGRMVGVVGCTTEDTNTISKPGPNTYFDEVEPSLAETVAELENLDVDIIVALSHCGLNRDKAIAATVDGIDIIVGGHTHSLLSNTDPEAEGPYPVVVESPSGNNVLVVTAKCWGQYLGTLDVSFDENGVPVEWTGEPVLLDSSVPEDPHVKAVVDEMNTEVEPLTHMVVGNTTVELSGDEGVTRHYESNLGDLICDAMLWDTRHSGIRITLFNGGGIRSGIGQGDITMAEVLEVLPFGDTLATCGLMGSDLRDTLEFGVSRAEDPMNEGTGRFLQVAGLKYTWDPSQPVGSRIVEVLVENEDGTYSPLEDETLYEVATSDYLRHGHDGFDILLTKAIDPYDFGRVISDVIIDYLGEYSPVAPHVEGRITRVGE